MRVIFVGLHNKPGMKPLDSKTKSGKLINRVIDSFTGVFFLKTNLFDTDYYPNRDERESTNFYWYDRVSPETNDVIVLLGAATVRDFPEFSHTKIIKAAHPASKRSHKEMDEYVDKLVRQIKSLSSLRAEK